MVEDLFSSENIQSVEMSDNAEKKQKQINKKERTAPKKAKQKAKSEEKYVEITDTDFDGEVKVIRDEARETNKNILLIYVTYNKKNYVNSKDNWGESIKINTFIDRNTAEIKRGDSQSHLFISNALHNVNIVNMNGEVIDEIRVTEIFKKLFVEDLFEQVVELTYNRRYTTKPIHELNLTDVHSNNFTLLISKLAKKHIEQYVKVTDLIKQFKEYKSIPATKKDEKIHATAIIKNNEVFEIKKELDIVEGIQKERQFGIISNIQRTPEKEKYFTMKMNLLEYENTQLMSQYQRAKNELKEYLKQSYTIKK